MITLNRFLIYLLIGAVLALGAAVANATTVNLSCGGSCDTLNFGPPAVGSCANGTQVTYILSVGGQVKRWEWSGGTGGSWGLVQWDCPSCWTGDSINWYENHGYHPVSIGVYDSHGQIDSINFSISSGAGTATQNIRGAGTPSGCTAAPCGDDVTITAHWGTGGAPHAADVVVNFIVGGVLGQVSCDANGCNSGTYSHTQLNATGAAPYNVDGGVDGGSWAICGVPGSRYKTTVTNQSAFPSSIACGGTIDIALDAHCAASPTPSPPPSASIAPSPSTTPVLSPSPAPSPLTFETPEPWASAPPGMPGATHASGTLTKADIYDAVLQGMQDAGKTGDWYAPNGSFGYGSDPAGENGTAGNNLQSAVNRFTSDLTSSHEGLMGAVDAIDSLNLPTSIGDKSSWDATLPLIGEVNIDLSGFDTPVYAFRTLALGIMIIGAWFAMVKIIRSGIA